MNSVKIFTLCSGSSGNCTYCRFGETAFLIDAGASRRTIGKALESIGSSLSEIAAIFITHEHSDHIKGLEMLAKYDKIPIYIDPLSARSLSSIDPDLIIPMKHPASVTLGKVTVSSFDTMHDSLSSCGFVISYEGERFGYATDIGKPTFAVTDALCGCRAVILEANYDKDMLRQGPYPLSLKQRICGDFGHMDNETSAKFCAFLGKRGTERILLAHLSNENNTPDVAYQTVLKKLEEENLSLSLGVADRYAPTELITLPLC